MHEYQELIDFLRRNWTFPHQPNEADIMTAISEYKRCKNLSDDEYRRWVNYEEYYVARSL